MAHGGWHRWPARELRAPPASEVACYYCALLVVAFTHNRHIRVRQLLELYASSTVCRTEARDDLSTPYARARQRYVSNLSRIACSSIRSLFQLVLNVTELFLIG